MLRLRSAFSLSIRAQHLRSAFAHMTIGVTLSEVEVWQNLHPSHRHNCNFCNIQSIQQLRRKELKR